MAIGAFGENFPYSNFHDLNMDWIVKIAKDFLDQYTTIQDVITTGETELEELSVQLTDALNEWYDTHSEDIAEQLADALSDLNNWYTTHQNYLDQTLASNIAAFNLAAETKAEQTIATIPADYSSLASQVADMPPLNVDGTVIQDGTNLIPTATVYEGKYVSISNNAIVLITNASYNTYKIPVVPGLYYANKNIRFGAKTNANGQVVDVLSQNVTNINCYDPSAWCYISISVTDVSGLIFALAMATRETKYINRNMYATEEARLTGIGFERLT